MGKLLRVSLHYEVDVLVPDDVDPYGEAVVEIAKQLIEKGEGDYEIEISVQGENISGEEEND